MQQDFKIGDWRVEPATGQVSNGKLEQRLEPKAMAVLVYLADHAGDIVTRQELEENIWQGTVVTHEALTVTINKIRSALGDDSRHPRFIETLSKRGYRLIATVSNKDSAQMRIGTGSKLALARQLAVGSVLIIGLLLAGKYLLNGSPTDEQSADDDRPSIAVIPFANMSGEKAQDYFAAGMTEYLITDLSRLKGLVVISRNSVFSFDSESVDIKQVSQTLKVRYVLTGSVLKNKDVLRVAVQLTDASNGVQLWANRYDGKLDELFTLQDDISRQITAALFSRVTFNEQELGSHNYTNNPAAHDYYIRGNALYTSITKEANSLAREMFNKALALDPKLASAHSAIALTYVDDYRRKWSRDPSRSVELALASANRAIKIDKDAAVAHWVLAYTYLYGRKQPHKAVDAAQQALRLFPNYADAYAVTASAYSFIGRSLDAIRVNRQAMRLNPTSSFVYSANLGRDYYFLGQYDRAIESLKMAIFRNENYLNAHLYLAATYARIGQIDDAEWEVEKIIQLDPAFSLKYWAGTQPYTEAERLQRMVLDLRKAGIPE